MSAAERTADRRARLLIAGRSLWAAHGWDGVKVRAVTAQAGLIDRYFYESFADRDALLNAVFDEVSAELFAILANALASTGDTLQERIDGALEALVDVLVNRPDITRIGLADHLGHPELETRRFDLVLQMTDFLGSIAADSVAEDVTPKEFRMVLLLNVSGFDDVVRAWQAGRFDATTDELVEYASRLAHSLIATYTPGSMR